MGAGMVRLAMAEGDAGRARQAAAAVADVASRNDVTWLRGVALQCQGLAEQDAGRRRRGLWPGVSPARPCPGLGRRGHRLRQARRCATGPPDTRSGDDHLRTPRSPSRPGPRRSRHAPGWHPPRHPRGKKPPGLIEQAFDASPALVNGATQVTSDRACLEHLLFRPSMRPCENVRMDGLACPCGLGDDYASCCGRLHAGAPALTAESLMRSRYSAFAVGDAGYLRRTCHPSGRPRTLSLDPALSVDPPRRPGNA